MVFTPTTLFKGIACPQGDSCKLTNCIYGHEATAANTLPPTNESTHAATGAKQSLRPARDSDEPAHKRRKLAYDNFDNKPVSTADKIRSQIASTRAQQNNEHTPQTNAIRQVSPASLSRPVSPPPTRANGSTATSAGQNGQANGKSAHKTQSSATPSKVEKFESLNPRLVPNAPVGHQIRLKVLEHLHREMTRLNKQVEDSESRQLLYLTNQKLIQLALDEEEKYAREQPKLYDNVIRQRIAALKKMSTADWLKHINATLAAADPPKVNERGEEKRIETGLRLEYEHLLLPQLVVDQKPLAAWDYIPTPPSEAQAAEANAAQEMSKNYEVCDRCQARFQMFPSRDEGGRIASSGPCFFHPYRKVTPPKQKSDRYTGAKEAYHPCCNEKVGAPGCTRHEDHVFKTDNPARLAAVMPFINTPSNPTPSKDRRGNEVKAVTFDCEMGYTALGLELIRITAVAWPSNEMLLDTLVRPLGTIIDLNSRFSGVFQEHMSKAMPYSTWEKQRQSSQLPASESGVLPIVDSPYQARELLCSFITPTTPLIGHAINNDLNTVRLCHPTIIDTIILYPHPRGLPMRFGLKMLTQRHLNRYIQTGGERGHDSLEDAVATGDLVRIKVGETWRKLRAAGWKIINQQLVPPVSGEAPNAEAQHQWLKTIQQGIKRKQQCGLDGAEEGGDDYEEVHDREKNSAAVAQ